MEIKVLLAKSITLLYQESKLPEKVDNSQDLVRTVLDNVQVSEIGIGMNTEREVILALKDTILEMCSNDADHEYNKVELLQRIKINTASNEKIYDAIANGLDDTLSDNQIKRMIGNIRKSITNHFKEQQIADVLNKATYAFKFNREKIKDINLFLSELQAQLEPLQATTGNKDPAVMSDIDIGNKESMHEVFESINKQNNGTGLYKTGWTALNRMLQGGFRPGETTIIGALQHKYKSGFSMSLFAQIALHNKPLTTDPGKKPLLLRISFEDDAETYLQFLYTLLKYNDTREYVDIREIPVDEMSSYVTERLQVNGFHVKMMRVDPTQWSYKHICNKVVELEAEGYNVELLMVDYLGKLPTTGCSVGGPAGNDIREMIRRMRNFCSA